jgi:hypothetical protein
MAETRRKFDRDFREIAGEPLSVWTRGRSTGLRPRVAGAQYERCVRGRPVKIFTIPSQPAAAMGRAQSGMGIIAAPTSHARWPAVRETSAPGGRCVGFTSEQGRHSVVSTRTSAASKHASARGSPNRGFTTTQYPPCFSAGTTWTPCVSVASYVASVSPLLREDNTILLDTGYHLL